MWDKKDIPHKGWSCVDMVDLREDEYCMDIETLKSEIYEQCQMCNQEGIRYVHIMEHPDYVGRLRVGRICAEKMESDYSAPKKRENGLRNRNSRMKNFFKREWKLNQKGNYVLKYKRELITIMLSKYNESEYGIAYNDTYTWKYKKRKIKDLKTARLAAFYIVNDNRTIF